MIDDEEKSRILDEIIEYSLVPSIEPDEFTVYDYLDRLEERGLEKPARCTVRSRLDRLVEAGKLSKRRALRDGKVYTAYRQIGNTE